MMRKITTRGIIAFILAFVISMPSWAANESEPRLITVTGDAEVRVVPDEVILTLGVETWNKDLAVAKSQKRPECRAGSVGSR